MPFTYHVGADAFVYVAAGGGGGGGAGSLTARIRPSPPVVRPSDEEALRQARLELERAIRKQKHRDSIGAQTYIPFPDLKENS